MKVNNTTESSALQQNNNHHSNSDVPKKILASRVKSITSTDHAPLINFPQTTPSITQAALTAPTTQNNESNSEKLTT